MVDLGMSPLANAYLTAEQLHQMEPFYPLRVYVCEHCWLVQLEAFTAPESIFSDYAYFSSYSDSWLQHAKAYVAMAVERFGLNATSQVIEVASNDGYLLQYFVAQGIPVLGIEPAENVAAVAQQRGISTLVQFFGEDLAKQLVAHGTQADLVSRQQCAGACATAQRLCAWPEAGAETARCHHDWSFHTCYGSWRRSNSIRSIMSIFPTFPCARCAPSLPRMTSPSLTSKNCPPTAVPCASTPGIGKTHHIPLPRGSLIFWCVKRPRGLQCVDTYLAFAEEVKATKRRCLEFFLQAKQHAKSLVGYGAPAKGNTLLNYLGVRTDFLDYTVDRSPHKQGHFLPGTHIPILHPDVITTTKPDYLVILPWNLQEEIRQQMAHIREWGGQFVTLIPDVVVSA